MNQVALKGVLSRCYVGESKKGVPYAFLSVSVDELDQKGNVIKNTIPCRIFGSSASVIKDVCTTNGVGMATIAPDTLVEVKGKLVCKPSKKTDQDGNKIYETFVQIEFIRKAVANNTAQTTKGGF